MSIFRTIAMFLYLFGYMIVHYGTLRRAERALAAGDTETVEQLVIESMLNKNMKKTDIANALGISRQALYKKLNS